MLCVLDKCAGTKLCVLDDCLFWPIVNYCLNLTTYLIIHVTVKLQSILFLSGAIFMLVLWVAPYVYTFRVPFSGWSLRAIHLTGPGDCWEWRCQSHKSLHLLLWQHVSVFPGTAPNVRLQTIDRPDTEATFLILLGTWNEKLGLLLGRPVLTAEMWSWGDAFKSPFLCTAQESLLLWGDYCRIRGQSD